MAVPTFSGAGAGASGTFGSTNNIPYPSGIVAGDILIISFFAWAKAAPSTPSGFTAITNVAGHYAWWKVADGTETGTVAITQGDAAGRYGRMYKFSGAAASVDNVVTNSGLAGTDIEDAGVTTSTANRLAVQLVAAWDNIAIGDFTGESGGDWTEAIAEYTSTTGNDGCLQVQTADMVSAGTINGGTIGLGGTGPDWAVIGFSLVATTSYPVGTAIETDVALSITPVLLPPGLKANIGSAVETDTALSITPAKDNTTDIDMYVAMDFGTGMEVFDLVRTQSLNVRRGRANNLDRVQTGTAEGSFLNGDGYLDPSYTLGPNYGKIHPLLPVRILRRRGGVTYERFTGGVERFNPDWESLPTTQLMGVGAADVMEKLANDILVSDYATLTTSLTGTNNDLVFTAKEAGGHGDDITIEYVVAGNNTPLGADTNDPLEGSAILSTETHSLQEGILGTLFGQKTTPPVSVQVQGSDIIINVATNGSGVPTSTAAQIKTAMDATPAIAALVSVAYAPGNNGSGVVTALPKANLTGGKWPEEYTGARINRVLDLFGWPAAMRDIDAGNYIVVAQGFALRDRVSPLTHMHDVADSELGYVFVKGNGVIAYHDASHRNVDARSTSSRATFSNVTGSGHLITGAKVSLDKSKIVNEATVTGGRQGAVPQTVQNAHSQDGVSTPPPGAPSVPPGGYGHRAISRQTLLANDEDCLAQATQIVTALSYPLERFESMATFEPPDPDDDAWSAAVLDLEIGDRITVIIRPPGKTTMSITSYTLFVEEIQDVYAPATPMKVVLVCSPTAASVAAPPPPGVFPVLNNLGGPLIIGDAVQGKIGA